MTDLEALLKAVLANPDDDTARLVYADELEACGQAERAGFIRDSIANPNGMWWFRGLDEIKLGDGPFRINLDNYLDEYAIPSPNILNPRSPGLVWHRGFIEEILCTSANWIECGDGIVEEYPVRKVTLTTPSPVLVGAIRMYEGKPCILIAGKWIDCSSPGGYPELDKRVLHDRWPSIPIEGWRLPRTLSI